MNNIIFFICIIATLTSNAFSNTVSVILDSKWQMTPLLTEASEFFASKSTESFWNFLNELNKEKDQLVAAQSEVESHVILTRVAKRLLTSGELEIMQLALSLRSYSPSVEMNLELDKSVDCAGKNVFGRVNDNIVCNLEELENAVNLNSNKQLNSTILYKTDKIIPLVESISYIPNKSAVVFVYGDLRDNNFYDWHEKAMKLTQKPNVYYVFRHKIKNRTGKTRLSGYGVELAIKSTEYKAVDDTKLNSDNAELDNSSESAQTNDSSDDEVQGFIFSKLKDLHPNSASNLDAFRRHLQSSDSTEILPLKAWQIQELSLKAGQFIMSTLENNQALQTLRDISQNYPVRANFLANNVKVSSSFKQELQSNQAVLEQSYGIVAGQSMILFNGYMLSQDLDIFEIIDLARREMGIMTRLHDFGLRGDQISSITNVQHTGENGNSGAKVNFILNIGSAPISFINNLEKDSRYSTWPNSVRDMLTPTYPGVMRRVAKNFFNTILVLNPILMESREYVKFVEAFIIHSAPIRMGFLWAIDPEVELTSAPGRALVRAFNFVVGEKDDALAGLSFITDFYNSIEDSEDVSVDEIKTFLKDKHPDVDMDMVFGENSDYDDNIRASWKFIQESGLQNIPRPFMLFNGVLIDNKQLSEQGFEESVVNNVMVSTGEIQKLIMNYQMADEHSFLHLLMSADNVVDRLNQKILDTRNQRFLTFTKSHYLKQSKVDENYLKMSKDNITTILSDKLQYFVFRDDYTKPREVSIWLIVDADTESGRSDIRESLKWVQNSMNCRLGIVQSPSVANVNGPINRIIYNIIKKLPNDQARLALVALLESETNLEENLKKFLEKEPKMERSLGDYNNVPSDYLALEEAFVKNVLNVEPGKSLVVANGKVFGPFETVDSLLKNDFKLVERSCLGAWQLLKRLQKIFGSGANQAVKISDLTMKIHSTLMRDFEQSSQASSQVGIMSNTKKIELLGLLEEHTSFSLMGSTSKPAFDLVAVLDPLTRTAQKLSHILLVLKEALNVNVKIILNCKDKLSEQPLKSFYRFVLDAHPIVKDEEGHPVAISNPRAHFTRLPSQPLLTLGLEPIHNWLVESTKSAYDLDNLRFADYDSKMVQAHFELEYLLLEGHCVDLTTGQPPRGLQFELTTPDGVTTHDTIVMANLGYFQLKANPGAWNLRLREGKSKDIYEIVDHEYTDNDDKSNNVVAVLDSFRSKIIRIKVNKKPSKLKESLLSESRLDEDTSSIWASISNAFTKNSGDKDQNETINIFSVASGHLYERFLRIMMISVLKNTKSKVKFWFLKNYLSPTFKEFIPHMAKKYGFEYDLVQYKWPRWLHEQTEKQRLIWGYKILFLDVLFPLNVSKIIFVDADQMVRANLQELVDLDLEGAPYGYTPFCNSRREMDGFRFWRTGYWNMHLAGRPYHISALYVVDLIRFRQMAAGDRLRGQYHGLSQDPNSLSNLDQDLPNNMIHQVPIKSLPQEWLWCETWCSDEEKKHAKTIDLCNNPQTKEPKLSAAMRILPEWKGYDDEIKSLWNKVYQKSHESDNSATQHVPKSQESDKSDIPSSPQSSSQSKTEL